MWNEVEATRIHWKKVESRNYNPVGKLLDVVYSKTKQALTVQ